MLNGVEPLLIITFKNKGILDFFGPDSLVSSLVGAIGLPIPIYLSEKLTGIYVDTESSAIDVKTEVEPVTAKNPLTLDVEPPVVSQTAVDSQCTINLLANDDCILLTALIALMEELVKRLVSQEYSISYLNGSTAIFGGLLHRFATNRNRNDNLVRIELSISTAAKESPIPSSPIAAISKVTGAVPL